MENGQARCCCQTTSEVWLSYLKDVSMGVGNNLATQLMNATSTSFACHFIGRPDCYGHQWEVSCKEVLLSDGEHICRRSLVRRTNPARFSSLTVNRHLLFREFLIFFL